jgi:hypothetical protein
VPKLEVPQVTEFISVTGNKYVRERSLEEIAEQILKPAEDEEEDQKK